jgi:hypothetical protein
MDPTISKTLPIEYAFSIAHLASVYKLPMNITEQIETIVYREFRTSARNKYSEFDAMQTIFATFDCVCTRNGIDVNLKDIADKLHINYIRKLQSLKSKYDNEVLSTDHACMCSIILDSR